MKKILPIIIPLLLLISGCEKERNYFLVGDREKDADLVQLFELFEQEENSENRFVLVSRISNILLGSGHREKQVLFLTNYVEKYPTDIFNSFFLFVVAQAYNEEGAWPFAVHYYERILKNHPDILVREQSIHYRCLVELVKLATAPESIIDYYKELISRFKTNIDPGKTYYYLARKYEEIGQWDQAIQAFQEFQKYPQTEIAGFPDIHKTIKEKITFYYSNKSWTEESLDRLVINIKSAIRLKNMRSLDKYKSKVKFTTRLWDQKESDSTRVIMDISSFLLTSKVRAGSTLDAK